jgi:anti-anti-sigma factor
MTIGAPHFHVQIESDTDPIRVVASGELDAASAASLATALEEATASSTTIALDLGGVTFIDSSGLRVIAAEVQRANDGGAGFAVSAASDAVRRIFEMTGLTSLLPG